MAWTTQTIILCGLCALSAFQVHSSVAAAVGALENADDNSNLGSENDAPLYIPYRDTTHENLEMLTWLKEYANHAISRIHIIGSGATKNTKLEMEVSNRLKELAREVHKFIVSPDPLADKKVVIAAAQDIMNTIKAALRKMGAVDSYLSENDLVEDPTSIEEESEVPLYIIRRDTTQENVEMMVRLKEYAKEAIGKMSRIGSGPTKNKKLEQEVYTRLKDVKQEAEAVIASPDPYADEDVIFPLAQEIINMVTKALRKMGAVDSYLSENDLVEDPTSIEEESEMPLYIIRRDTTQENVEMMVRLKEYAKEAIGKMSRIGSGPTKNKKLEQEVYTRLKDVKQAAEAVIASPDPYADEDVIFPLAQEIINMVNKALRTMGAVVSNLSENDRLYTKEDLEINEEGNVISYRDNTQRHLDTLQGSTTTQRPERIRY